MLSSMSRCPMFPSYLSTTCNAKDALCVSVECGGKDDIHRNTSTAQTHGCLHVTHVEIAILGHHKQQSILCGYLKSRTSTCHTCVNSHTWSPKTCSSLMNNLHTSTNTHFILNAIRKFLSSQKTPIISLEYVQKSKIMVCSLFAWLTLTLRPFLIELCRLDKGLFCEAVVGS